MSRAECVLEADFIVSRDWEPEETDEGLTINTTPNPTLKLFETANGTVMLFCVKTPDPIVHTAVLAGHTEIEDMIQRAVESVEDNFDGISDVVEAQSLKEFADPLLEHLYDCVEEVTPDDD